MQKIKQLPLSEIQKIAAGQVVERPANVVKELLENALDAGSTKISLYIEQGGERLIRVVDNGAGMSAVDAIVCFERHATSKLSSFEELQRLQTFGFRGEALSSIGAVSDVTLITKEADAPHGIRVSFAQGAVLNTEDVSCSTGTDISVQNIFAHVPVRKKFLKKEETELRIIIQLFQAFCFSYPAIHFQFFSDNNLLYNCPPSSLLINRSAQVWDTSLANNMVSLQSYGTQLCSISGIISQHHFFRYNRNQIFFFVNKRWIKNYTVTQALLKGYLNVLPPARYPVAIVDIQIDPSHVDVNVHPRKEEVKFLHDKQIEAAISGLVKKSLETALSKHINNTKERVTGFSEVTQQPKPLTLSATHQSNNLPERSFFVATQQRVETEPFFPEKNTEIVTMQTESVQHVQESVTFENRSYELLGVVKKTYILLDHPDGIVFVDQHAAHERILFERFGKQFEETSSVKLMFPEIVNMVASDIQIIMDHITLLHEHGIIVDRFGKNQIIITAVPVYLKSISWSEFLRGIIDMFIEHEALQADEFFTVVNKKLQAQMACKAAVKAGDVLTDQQINQLLVDLDSVSNRYTCPHGRPTSWLLSLSDIEKKFKRKL